MPTHIHPSEATRRFGYTPGSFRVLCHQFRQDPHRPFFLPATQGPRAAPMAEAVRFEWMSLLDLVQRLYPKGRFSERARKAMEIGDYLPAQGLFLPAPEKTIAGIDEWFHPMLAAASKPWSPDALSEMDTAASDERRAKVPERNLILQIRLPSLYHTHKSGLQTEAHRRATLLVLSMQLYRDRHGRWPQTLDDCALPDLKQVRLDPVSGREFVYQVRDGRPRLYSAGYDGEDDGGKHDRRWGLDRAGHDFVLFPPP